MKRCYAFTALCFLLAVLGGGCGEEGWGREHHVFYSEKHSFECMEHTAASVLSFFDLGLRLDASLMSDGTFCRDSLEAFLPGYRLCPAQGRHWYGVLDGDSVFVLICGGQHLSQVGTVWEIGGLSFPYKGSAVVKCVDARTWNLSVSVWGKDNWLSLASLNIQYAGGRPPGRFGRSDWSISGNWCSLLEDKCYVDFDIACPLMHFSDSPALFDGGQVYIRQRDLFVLEEELIRVDMKPEERGGRILEIGRKNVRFFVRGGSGF